MPQRPLSVILLVILTMSAIALLYSATLAIIATQSIDHEFRTLAIGQFKDFAIYAAGALSGFLAKLSTGGGEPQDVKITNPPSDPANVKETVK